MTIYRGSGGTGEARTDSDITEVRALMMTTEGYRDEAATSAASASANAEGFNTFQSSGTAKGVAFLDDSNVLTTSSGLLYNSVNLGIGVTPSSWGSGFKGIEFSNGPFGTYVVGRNGTFYAGTNNYFDGFDYIYKASGNATQYAQSLNGRHTWYTSASSTVGNVVSFVQAMQLNENSNLSVTGQISGGYLSNGTNTAAQQLGSYTVVKNTISASTTFTTTVAAAGSRSTVLIVSSGTTSRTVTFGTGFLSTGTLSTGTTSGKTFAISFVSDGTTMIETGRTAAM